MHISSLRSAYNKNWPELKAAFNGQLPNIVLKKNVALPLEQAITFVFHTTNPKLFEEQLQFITSNGYRTLDAHELYEKTLNNTYDGNEIALTFDDATSTFWTYAFPLLRKYNCKAILFAIAGLVPEDLNRYPNLNDFWNHKATSKKLRGRLIKQPLCTWNELITMHESGLVDVQSHSMTHSRIPVSSKIVDYIHPKFDPYFYNNVMVPIQSADDHKNPQREFILGFPIFENKSKLTCTPRFLENSIVTDSVKSFIEQNRNKDFFKKNNWRRQLDEHFKKLDSNELGNLETLQQTKAAVKFEFSQSKAILESKLKGKTIKHFCYPWYESSELADEIAYASGYQCLHYGLDYNYAITKPMPNLVRIKRISEEYLFRLPGENRKSYLSIWSKRASNFLSNNKSNNVYTE